VADFGGFKVQTPQDIQNALLAQRQAVRLEGSPQQNRQANITTALDTLFGNPQMNLAKRMQGRIQTAEASLQPVEGESDLTREIRRLKAIRDSVADLSPETAAQVNTQLLELGQAQLEQDKLLGDQRRAEADDARERALHPYAVAEAQDKQLERENAGVNYWRKGPKGIERQNVAELDSLERRALRMRGWVEGTGPTTEAEAGDALGLTKPTTGDLQGTLIGAQNLLDSLLATGEKYDPSFTSLPKQLLEAGAAASERAGGKLMSQPSLACTTSGVRTRATA
jgi:hypothetical protein